jgi:hypothetical protein
VFDGLGGFSLIGQDNSIFALSGELGGVISISEMFTSLRLHSYQSALYVHFVNFSADSQLSQ